LRSNILSKTAKGSERPFALIDGERVNSAGVFDGGWFDVVVVVVNVAVVVVVVVAGVAGVVGVVDWQIGDPSL